MDPIKNDTEEINAALASLDKRLAALEGKCESCDKTEVPATEETPA